MLTTLANGSNRREIDLRVLGLTSAGLSRALLLRVIMTGEVLLRVLGLTGGVLPAEVLGSAVLGSAVLASWVLALAAFVILSHGLILISNWAHRGMATRHSTIHHIRGRECHIMAVVDGGMSQIIL